MKTILRYGFLLTALLAAVFLTAQGTSDSKSKIVYVNNGVLWARTLPEGTPSEISQGGQNPQWSPSGDWISYDTPGRVLNSLHARAMGPPFTVLDFQFRDEAHWSPTKDELAYVTPKGLMLFRPARQGPRVDPQIIYPTEDPHSVMNFCWSMDGERLAVLVRGETPTLWNVDPATKHAEQVAVDADLGSAKLAGWTSDRQRIVLWPNPEESESAAADGLPLIAVSLSSPTAVAFVKEPVLRYADFLSFSPHRPDILVTSGGYRDSWTNKQIIAANPANGQTLALSNRKSAVASIAWSPDGESIAYSAGPDGGPLKGGNPAKAALNQRHIWVMKANGQQPRQLTSDARYRDEYPIWSKDGRYLVFTRMDTQDNISVWGIDPSGGTPTKLVDSIMGGVSRNGDAWFGDYGHMHWEAYLAWSR